MTADTREPAPEPPLTVDELAARAGVTVRTVRFYSTRGLLPPPVLGPRRVGRYGLEHLSRLALIEELQRHGMTLAAIERYLEGLPDDLSPQDLAVQRALVASWAPEQTAPATRAELERRAGRPLTGHDLDRLAALDVIAPVAGENGADGMDGTDAGEFRVDPGLLDVGIRLLDVPFAQETVLAARAALLEHSRAAAAELARLFRAELEGSGTEPDGSAVGGTGRVDRARSLSAHMQPLVLQALVTAFQRSLTQELRAWLRHEK